MIYSLSATNFDLSHLHPSVLFCWFTGSRILIRHLEVAAQKRDSLLETSLRREIYVFRTALEQVRSLSSWAVPSLFACEADVSLHALARCFPCRIVDRTAIAPRRSSSQDGRSSAPWRSPRHEQLLHVPHGRS
jgi:hypothetical protein